MSQVLTVPTHFNDIGELSEGFLDRVERDTLILYGPVAYEDGSEIEFVVLLADGSLALEGTGRVRAAVDGGADRVPETRYDVVVEALELDGRYEVVFERLVLARQAVSDRPPVEDDAPPTNDMDAAPDDDEPIVEATESVVEEADLVEDEVYSLAPEDVEPVTVPPGESVSPEESAPDTVPPEAFDEEEEDDDEEDEPATVIAAVDAEAMMAEAASEPVSASASEAEFDEDEDVFVEATISAAPECDEEPSVELSADAQAALEANADSSDERAPAEEAYDEAIADGDDRFDSEYAFEHGIAAEPQVGMPVPIPSMAAPPEAPPAPPTLRLAERPEGLTRPSLAQAEESLFTADGEVSDVHTTGLFVYEDGLPIPSRPPLPDPNAPQSAAAVEVADGYDVEDSEPPATNDDEYEEVRLSDFAEAAEEG
jgi:hypothetical protein